jgi:FkbM family methyltransferase
VWFFHKRHDAILKKFVRTKARCPAGFTIDFIGSLEATKFGRTSVAAREEINRKRIGPKPPLPSINDEYFEWISLLRSVSEAKSTFCFVELGAGYGRWAARAALAARQKEIETIRVLMVEAEPTHVAWAREHMANNGIEDFSIIDAAVGSFPGKRIFWVAYPNAPPNPDGWYGQTFRDVDDTWRETREEYRGKIIFKDSAGRSGVSVDVLTLEEILRPHPVIDLIDMDIQGAEAAIIKTGARLLASKVKRVHIATHTTEIEASIRETMKSLAWTCEWDFAFNKTVSTPFGNIAFADGAQAWRNPHLD